MHGMCGNVKIFLYSFDIFQHFVDIMFYYFVVFNINKYYTQKLVSVLFNIVF